MKDRLLTLPESLSACDGRPLMEQKVLHRASMAALSMAGIDHCAIAIFAETHARTVYRWGCRVEQDGFLTDLPRSGRPCCFSEAERLRTIAVYCQHAPPLPGLHIWSLRDAQR
jgi:transposase